MKKGFTMIELIFVIVILGILAAVAIPRLAATRDDAEMSKAAANLSTLIKDMSSYYTSQGNFSDKVGDMTNVLVTTEAGAANTKAGSPMYLQVKKALCFKIELGENKIERDDEGRITSQTFEPATEDNVKTEADAINVIAVAEGKGKKICTELFNLPAIKSTMTTSKVGVDTNKTFNVGGTGVVYDAYEADSSGSSGSSGS